MQTTLAPFMKGTSEGQEAADILGKCVHCGFCTATCPTYQLLGDELDGPRGRIYLIKEVLEGAEPTVKTQQHLDRCLTCLSCETTCPSGVQYGRLLSIGRKLVDQRVKRSIPSRLLRGALRNLCTGPLFKPVYRVGQVFRYFLPLKLQQKLPHAAAPRAWPLSEHKRRVLLLGGCVQTAMFPNISVATARVLDAVGIQSIIAPRAGCCGAIRHHLNDRSGALSEARRNIDAWWPYLESGIEAIVINASGCGAMVREYAHLLKDDLEYCDKARQVVEATRDIAEVIPEFLHTLKRMIKPLHQQVVFHAPCTLQHAQRIRGTVETILRDVGAQVLPHDDGHSCCGSAGTYSILQPELSERLRDKKIATLSAALPSIILSANVGCISQLRSGSEIPVRHWIEWVDTQMPGSQV